MIVDCVIQHVKITLQVHLPAKCNMSVLYCRFFCSMEQAYLTQVTWLSLMGSLYFLPKLFAIPSYRATMEALFPDPSLALTHMLRTFMLPADKVWAQVKIKEKQYLNNMHTQVGFILLKLDHITNI